MSEITYTVYGITFGEEDWVPLLGNLLVIIGISLTLYIALFVGNEGAVEGAVADTPAKKEKTEAKKTPEKAVKVEKARSATPTTTDKKRSTTPTTDKKRSTTPTTEKKEKKEAAPAAPATTPKKKAATPRKKAAPVEDMGHVMSPEGRRSMRLRTKPDEED